MRFWEMSSASSRRKLPWFEPRVTSWGGQPIVTELTPAGCDRLSGGSGPDRLSGGSGSDRISAGSDRDKVIAGSGNDRISVRDGARDTVNCGTGRDRVTADRRDSISRNCERVSR